MFLVHALAFFALLGAEPPHDKENIKYTPQGEHCLNTGKAAHGDLRAMENCMSSEIARQDKTLNLTYQHVLRALPVGERLKLRASERKWLSTYNRQVEQCASESGWDKTGHEYPIQELGCEIYLKVERIKFLTVELRRHARRRATAK